MAHWTERHTKKDIVASYEKELATLRAEVDRLREALEDADQTLMLIGDVGCRGRIKEALK